MLVEVFGPSCAGKSTLITDIHRALEEDRFSVETHDGAEPLPRGRRLMDIARASAHPRLMLWCLLNGWRAFSHEGRIFLRSVGLSTRLRGAAPIIFVLDEGPLKRVSTLAEGSCWPGLLLKGAPKPDMGILVECGFDIRLGRLRETGRSAALTQSDDELRQRDLAKTRWNQRIVAESGVDIVRIDTTSGADFTNEVAMRIRNRMVRI